MILTIAWDFICEDLRVNESLQLSKMKLHLASHRHRSYYHHSDQQ